MPSVPPGVTTHPPPPQSILEPCPFHLADLLEKQEQEDGDDEDFPFSSRG